MQPYPNQFPKSPSAASLTATGTGPGTGTGTGSSAPGTPPYGPQSAFGQPEQKLFFLTPLGLVYIGVAVISFITMICTAVTVGSFQYFTALADRSDLYRRKCIGAAGGDAQVDGVLLAASLFALIAAVLFLMVNTVLPKIRPGSGPNFIIGLIAGLVFAVLAILFLAGFSLTAVCANDLLSAKSDCEAGRPIDGKYWYYGVCTVFIYPAIGSEIAASLFGAIGFIVLLIAAGLSILTALKARKAAPTGMSPMAPPMKIFFSFTPASRAATQQENVFKNGEEIQTAVLEAKERMSCWVQPKTRN